MNLTRDRIRSIGWAFVLTVCIALTAGLTLRVNAVKGQVHEAEQKIVSVKREILFLETEFQTRANQQQLKTLNDIEFGYVAPGAAQYIEGERQLAALGKPRAPGAPKPIRFVTTVGEKNEASLMAVVSQNTSSAQSTAAASKAEQTGSRPGDNRRATEDIIGATIAAADLSDRLNRIELPEAGKE